MRKAYQERGELEEQVFPITPRQLESLIRLAEADARMHLSDTVGIEHAERAIEMMTMFLTITLRGDTGFAWTGMTAVQRQEKEDPRTLIVNFLKKTGSEGADLHDILDHLEEQGVSRNKAEKTIQQMDRDGQRIYQPRTGHFALQ